MVLKSYILIITKSKKRHQNTVLNHLIVPALGRHLWLCGRHFAPTGRFHRAKCRGRPLSSPSEFLLQIFFPTLVVRLRPPPIPRPEGPPPPLGG